MQYKNLKNGDTITSLISLMLYLSCQKHVVLLVKQAGIKNCINYFSMKENSTYICEHCLVTSLTVTYFYVANCHVKLNAQCVAHILSSTGRHILRLTRKLP
jgi:hypothetical protein